MAAHHYLQVSTETVTLVVDPDLLGPLRLVLGEDLALLQTYGVGRMILLTPDSWDFHELDVDSPYVVYLVRPVPTWMRIIASHVQEHSRKTRTWPITASARSSEAAFTTLSYLTPAGSSQNSGSCVCRRSSCVSCSVCCVACVRACRFSHSSSVLQRCTIQYMRRRAQHSLQSSSRRSVASYVVTIVGQIPLVASALSSHSNVTNFVPGVRSCSGGGRRQGHGRYLRIRAPSAALRRCPIHGRRRILQEYICGAPHACTHRARVHARSHIL